MSETKSTFRVDWRTGYVEVDVGNFFGSSNQKEISKLLKLARVYCTAAQQEKLLADLAQAKQDRTEAVSALAELRFKMQHTAEPYFAHAVLFAPSGYEKALIAQCERITRSAAKVKAEKWEAGYAAPVD